MITGMKVRITGRRCFTGTVLAVNDIVMVIREAPGITVTIRRDPASMTPTQWRCAGLPVDVYAMPAADFRKRLRDLLRKVRLNGVRDAK